MNNNEAEKQTPSIRETLWSLFALTGAPDLYRLYAAVEGEQTAR